MAFITNYSIWHSLIETLKTLNIAAGVSSFATFVNMLTTIFIYRSNRQIKIISNKQFKSDLFKQRYDLFSEMAKFISENLPQEDNSNEEKTKKPLLDFIFMAEKAKFLFPEPKLENYIEEVIKQLYLAYQANENEEVKHTDESQQWLKDQISSGKFSAQFSDYLILPK
ncbi:MAG: hypothetical protein LEGION0398_MBIBDBAK_01049 [Legionellaceae bacterium]